MAVSLVGYSSIVALLILLIAIGVFIHNATLQYREFKFHSELQPLKKFFFSMSIILAGSNLPILMVFWQLAQDQLITTLLASVVIISYSLTMLITAILFLVIYRFRAEA